MYSFPLPDAQFLKITLHIKRTPCQSFQYEFSDYYSNKFVSMFKTKVKTAYGLEVASSPCFQVQMFAKISGIISQICGTLVEVTCAPYEK
jgi:hypothetical protein